jgi:serine/threonine kinase 38
MVKEEIVEVIDGEQEEEENVVCGDGEDDVVSTLTMERVEAAKKFIENHYRSQMKHIQERKER